MGIQYNGPPRRAYREMNSLLNDNVLKPMARRIASKANEASSFGMYESWAGDYVSRVYGLNAPMDSERGLRLLKFLGQERP